jgi:hypothetical protein
MRAEARFEARPVLARCRSSGSLAGQFQDPPPNPGGGHEPVVGVGGEHEPGWHREAGAAQLTQVGGLAADRREVVGTDLVEPSDVVGHGLSSCLLVSRWLG